MKIVRYHSAAPVRALIACTFVAVAAWVPFARGADLPRAAAVPAGIQLEGLQHLPGALSAADVARYRRIYALQEEGRWHDAEHDIGTLTDMRLMGHVLAQKYLHPTKYRSKFTELRDWMAKYRDHPQAARIYKLALKRKPKSAKPPRAPFNYGRYGLATVGAFEPAPIPAKKLSSSQRHLARELRSQIRSRVRRGWPTGAVSLMSGVLAPALFADAEFDKLSADIAAAYYFAGEDQKALDAARRAARSGDLVPASYWWGGLAAFRLGDMAQAQAQFASLAQSSNASGWEIAAGAYWAARAAFVGRRPQEVNRLLAIGASHKRTFYGLLSRRALGLDLDFDWALPALGDGEAMALHASARGSRAVALLQVGLGQEAEQELRNLVRAKPRLIGPAVALTSRYNMPSLTLRLAWATAKPAPATLYPTTEWVPQQAEVDRALVHAIIRQESGFNARAKSRAGARGLMQLMPRTASYVGGQRSLRGAKRDSLYDPALNVDLGLKYVNQLLDSEAVGNDLFRLAAAYNAGPGNLRQWERKVDYRGDALLFIESLPSRETRTFIEHVLANLWIYRHRLGQPTPTLDAIAAGGWPRYVRLDGPVQTAQKQTAQKNVED